MPVYPNIRFYDFDPRTPFGTGNGIVGNLLVYTGPTTATGIATITDNGSSNDSALTLEDDNRGEEATADVTIGGQTSTTSDVDAEDGWTLRDTVTNQEFQVVRFQVEDGDASGSYTISEVPLIPGRSYEITAYDNNPDGAGTDPVLSYADYYAGWDSPDTDGDGVADVDDLDDDNDGILDTDERDIVEVSQSFAGTTNGTTNVNTFTIDSQDNGLTFDFYELDNSFDLSINGVSITSAEIQFQGGVAASGGVQNIQFADGTNYEAGGVPPVWSLTGAVDEPVIRVIISGNGDVQILGSKFDAGSPSYALEDMQLINGNTFQPFTWNTDSPNTIEISQIGTGPTVMDGAVFGTNIGTVDVDTDGDGIADHLDLDSDNDGISDLVESGQDAAIVDTDNDGVHDGGVNAQGVPIAANSGGGVDPVDTDGDLIADFRDLDSDGDGISDFIEAQPTAGYQPGDGDLTDDDADGDGVVDLFDSNDGTTGAFGGSFNTPVNTDGDTNPDYLDDDTDGDGILDVDESGLGAPGPDANGDGIGDAIGASYADPGGATDATDLSASNLQNTPGVGDPDQPDFRTVCFVHGTLIKTIDGDRPIEDLSAGDLVFTMDHGYQPLRWIGCQTLDDIDLALKPKLKPICIRADALGPGFPKTDLYVSPQHRILVRSVIAQRMFDTDEVLIPANKLVALNGIAAVDDTTAGVTYYHMLFDGHEIVFSNGTPSESLFTGPEALKSVSSEARHELETLFPQITDPEFNPQPARLIPAKGSQMKKLAQRHGDNSKPVFYHHS
ncbi:Hint domain-containing protein [Yoonia sp.]|uniref:Hint domain-containing protein n=1 Tax=Yoonia sp. TaxID=2212373 RepID=UPI00358F84AC